MGTITELGCVSVPTSEIAKVVDGGNFTIYHINGGIHITVPKKNADDENFELLKSVKYSDIIDIFDDYSYCHIAYVLLKNGIFEIIENISDEEINIISKKISGVAEILCEVGIGYFTTNMSKYDFSKCDQWMFLTGKKRNIIFKYDNRFVIVHSGQKLNVQKLSKIMNQKSILKYSGIHEWMRYQNIK